MNEFQSNRFSSSYYPPFQLLLPAMSAAAYCKLYFLVDGNTSVESIPAYANWDIDDLKIAIMNKVGLGHLETSDIILRKVRLAFWLA